MAETPKPKTPFQEQVIDFLKSPAKGQEFNWSNNNIYGDPIEIYIRVEDARPDIKTNLIHLAITLRLNGRSSSGQLASADPKLNIPDLYIGEKYLLVKWLDTMQKALRSGMHQHAIIDCVNDTLIQGQKNDDKNENEVYDSLLESLSKEQFRSMIEDRVD